MAKDKDWPRDAGFVEQLIHVGCHGLEAITPKIGGFVLKPSQGTMNMAL